MMLPWMIVGLWPLCPKQIVGSNTIQGCLLLSVAIKTLVSTGIVLHSKFEGVIPISAYRCPTWMLLMQML